MAELTPDLCIIGGGPAGIAAAMAARALGAEVVLIEADRLGGSRLAAGSVVARAFAALAARAGATLNAARNELGIQGASVDYAALAATARRCVDPFGPDVSAARLEALGIEVLAATASFVDRRRVRAGDTMVRARRVIIATGSQAAAPDIPGLAAVPHLTTDTLFDLADQPDHLIVLGAGPTAIELAQAHRRLGAAVTLVAADAPLAGFDPELVAILTRRLEAEGIGQHWSAAMEAVLPAPEGGVAVTLRQNEAEIRLVGSHLLVAAGRRPNVAGFGLERAGVRLRTDGRAGIFTGPSLKTSNPVVFAVGEVNGAEPSEALAVAEAELAVHAALFREPIRRQLSIIPRAVLTDPPIAEIGITEPMALATRKGRYRVHRLAYAQSDRARIESRTPGLAKLVTDPSGQILGAGIVGAEAPELVALIAFAMDRRIPASRLSRFVPPYPAYAALLRDLGRQAAGNAPALFSPARRLRPALLSLMRRLP